MSVCVCVCVCVCVLGLQRCNISEHTYVIHIPHTLVYTGTSQATFCATRHEFGASPVGALGAVDQDRPPGRRIEHLPSPRLTANLLAEQLPSPKLSCCGGVLTVAPHRAPALAPTRARGPAGVYRWRRRQKQQAMCARACARVCSVRACRLWGLLRTSDVFFAQALVRACRRPSAIVRWGRGWGVSEGGNGGGGWQARGVCA